MAELPDSMQPELADVDTLFPAQEQSVDELFPAEIEKQRFRRQQLNTSPVQDLIFGGTEVNPIARVLDAFGQGAKHAWGASRATLLSKQAEDVLKVNKQFDEWNEGQNSIIKAANEVLFRPAATQIVREINDVAALWHGVGAGIAGTQKAIAQVGEEVGQPQLGREVAAGFEVFPTGVRLPTGIPHAPRGALSELKTEIKSLDAEIQRARDLKVIGEGEAGWAGVADETAPVEAAKAPEPVVTPEAAPIDVKPQVAPETPPVAEVPTIETPADRIAPDIETKLIAAGRPAEEAAASAALIEAHYQARAERFKGALGTAEDLYRAEGPEVRGGTGTAPVRSEPIKPPEGEAGAVDATPEIKPMDGGAAELPTVEVRAPTAKGRAAADPQTWSLNEYLASRGGLKADPELEAIYGGKKSPFVSGFGPLVRKDGMTLDQALTAAKEGGYIMDAAEIEGRLVSVSSNDLLRLLNEEQTGRKQYRTGQAPKERDIDPQQEAKAIVDALHEEVAATGGDVRSIDRAIEDRVVEIVQKERVSDVMAAYERAIMEVEYNQIKRGKIAFKDDARPVITLFKDANESTFIHETGHHWLEELMKDAKHPKAPADLIADSKAVLDWLGVREPGHIKTSHHEKFARGFERYMMEGKAPTQALANVFEQFKDWLTRIYQTVTRLKSPINDEIRGVFDRLLATRKEDVQIDAGGQAKAVADLHEADLTSTPPESAHPVAQTVQAERDMLAAERLPRINDARLEGTSAGPERREGGGPQPVRDVNEARPDTGGAGSGEATGAISEGGSGVAPEGNPAPDVPRKAQDPVSPQDPFTDPPTTTVDKAGNIRLDNLGTPEDVNVAIREAAATNNDFIDARRGVVTDGQVLELADALGMDEGQLNARKLGQAFNAEQIMAARKLLIQSATNVRDAMINAAKGGEAEIMAYAEAKTRHQMIQEQVAGITAEAGRALRAFRKLEGQAEAKQIDAFLKDATGKTLFQLQREAKLGALLESPAQVSKFVHDSVKPSWKDRIIELWISALLSGWKTHAANIIGNTSTVVSRVAETTGAAAIGKARNLITGTNDRVLFGEAAAELYGIVQGSKEGVVAGYKAFRTEEPQLTSATTVEKNHPKALPSATLNVAGREIEIGGKQARIPLRLLGAEDEFFKAVAFRQSINRQAYAAAAKENLPAEQFNARVDHLKNNPTEAMINAAKDVAEYQTFQTPLGPTGRAIQNFANSHIGAKFIVPFVRTGTNLLKYANERTPLGVFAKEARANLMGKNGAVARDTQIARMAFGTMIGVAAYQFAIDGLITGGGPGDNNKKALQRIDGWQPYSIRIGDMYYGYNRLDPFSIILGLVADAYEISAAGGSEDLEKAKIPQMIFAAITQNIMNRSSLKGPSDFIEAVSDPLRYGPGYIKGMLGTVVPAFVAQTAQTVDPVAREARTVLDGIKARIPGLSQSLQPRRDVWGEPITREGGLGPDIASPIPESRLKNDPVNKALLSAGYFPSKPDRKIRGVELTDQQYDDYARIAGRMAKMRLNAMVNVIGNTNVPAQVRAEMIRTTVASSREAARAIVMMQNPEILKKANDAKAAGLTKAAAN